MKEEALWNYPVISVNMVQDIEKVVKMSSKYPIRPPNSVIAHYKSSNPDKFSNTGLVNE
jgi:ecdysone 20-monooxygenase